MRREGKRGDPGRTRGEMPAAGEQVDFGCVAQPANELQPLVTDAEGLAGVLHIGISTLWKLDSAGRIPRGLRIGERCRRWELSEIQAWLAAGAPHRDRWEALRDRGGRR
jgi:predicted DNA-binding transcriptional regulator AlpA